MKRLLIALFLLVPSMASAQTVVDSYYRPISPTALQSVTSAAQAITFPIVSRTVRIVCTQVCFYNFRASGTTIGQASLATGIYLPANWVDYMNIAPQSIISVIGSAGGTIYITEVGH